MQHLQPGTADNRMTVLIRPGVYWIDDPDDPEIRRAKNGDHAPIGMHVRCPWLHLVGLGEQSDDVILASARGQTQGAVGNFTMFFFHGDGLLLENLTLGNYCNVDLVYRLDPSKNRPRRMEAICQAQLAFADGDYLEARNCRFISRLNTCPLTTPSRAAPFTAIVASRFIVTSHSMPPVGQEPFSMTATSTASPMTHSISANRRVPSSC